MQEDLNKKIGKATVWSSITEIIAKLISPIVNIILARLLLPEAFGAVATITMVITFAEIFTDAGFQKYIVQHHFETDEELNKNTDVAFWTNIIISVLITDVIIVFKDKIAELVGSPSLGNGIAVSSSIIIIVAFSSIQTARCRRDFDFKTLFFARIGSSIIPLIVTIPLAIVFRNFWALLIGTIASNLFTAVVLAIKSKWKPKFFYDFKILRQMFAFSSWTLLESISIWLTNNVGIFIVGKYLTDYYLGIYKTSMATVNSYMNIITAAILPVIFSSLSRYQDDEENFKKTYYGFQRLVALFVLPMGVGIFVFQDFVTSILLGNNWMEASGFIGIWGLTSALTIVCSYFSSEVYRSKGKPKISLFSQLIHLAFLVPTLVLSAGYGFKILYVSRSLIRIQGVLTGIIIMRVCFGFKFIDLIKNIFPTLISSVVMGVAGYLLNLISSGIIWQIFAVLICIIVYFAFLLIVFPNTRKEVLGSKYFLKFKSKFVKRKTSDNSEKVKEE